MNSILITGCNRGLGLGLVKALVSLPQPPQHLFTTCRNREQAKVSLDLTSKPPGDSQPLRNYANNPQELKPL